MKVNNPNYLNGLTVSAEQINAAVEGGGTSLTTEQTAALGKIEGLEASASEIDGVINGSCFSQKVKTTGYIVTPFHSSIGVNSTNTNTHTTFVPIWINDDVTIEALVVKVFATTNVGGKFVTGIYKSTNNGQIGDLIASSDETTLSSSTYKTYECPITQVQLKGGKYWLAMSRDETVASFSGVSNTLSSLLWNSLNFSSANVFGSKTNFPSIERIYSSTLPSSYSDVDITSSSVTTLGQIPSIGLKLV